MKIDRKPHEKEVQNDIDASGFEQNWILDKNGYFLIRINKDKKKSLKLDIVQAVENNFCNLRGLS